MVSDQWCYPAIFVHALSVWYREDEYTDTLGVWYTTAVYHYIFFFPQGGNSAVIVATAVNQLDILKELVGAGADLNLQNEVTF